MVKQKQDEGGEMNGKMTGTTGRGRNREQMTVKGGRIKRRRQEGTRGEERRERGRILVGLSAG